MKTHNKEPDYLGFYGEFGGAFIPELLRNNIDELSKTFEQLKNNPDF